MSFACIMFMALELDRSNLGQAVSDNLLDDLGLTTNDYNLGTTVRLVSFLCAEIPSQLVSKWMGPDRWIPMQMCLWSLVAGSQFWLSGRSSYLVCRALLGILQGGFIPDVVLYLSYFYKHHEMSLRLSWFWGMDTAAEIVADIMAYGILHMRGVKGYGGWRWLFLIEGCITFVAGIFAFLLMPPGPCQTASWFRGKDGWFTPREETIMVNRVLRDDPSKSGMHNRQPVTPKLLWKSICDYDLWPLYLIGMLFEIPSSPPGSYLTLSLRSLGFSTFQTNLLAIPESVLSIFTMFLLSSLSEWWHELTFTALLAQVWCIPFLIWLEVAYTSESNKWAVYAVMTVFLGQPYVAWNSRNSNTVRSRTVSAAAYNMFVQLSGIISAQIYREDDKPLYRRGNKVLLGILALNFVVYGFAKFYYVRRNQYRDRIWNGMTEEERLHYLATTKDEGNKRLDFRFEH
ncbi:Major facilitator superfamily domain, general substrate transporter [Niveomyces insectorum RCEF 264]|uniref:Major facilitator superfamily domain, general substrate transporter n=1 Tax=Niveomyces insectorum RCEF 264 TaxID=1081102 RepID=A0A167YMY2_9HYPO|nr:Major facilitator superfamily domain, general substrate transporter [Niveomyces insectorum RCEF 264]